MSDAYINIKLNGAEMRALMRMAKDDCRPMQEQIRYLLREKARELGIMPAASKDDRPVANAAT
jgi:hypothetical protein